jgi:hypothetical protein
MSDSHAEQLDPTVLGEQVGDDRRPAADYPPDQPLAVEDETIRADGSIAADDVATRADRRNEPGGPADDTADDTQGEALIEPGDDPDVRDDEKQLIAETGDRDPSPEAGAVHVHDQTG